MKVKALSLFASLFFIAGSTAFSADIPITGPEIVYGLHDYTYYAYPPTPIAPGTTFAWTIYDGDYVVAQNTDPAAGPLYITLRWEPVLAEDLIEITDNHGNSGSLWIQVWGWGYASAVLQNPFSTNEKEGLNGFKAAYTYVLHEAIAPGNKKKAIKKRTVIA